MPSVKAYWWTDVRNFGDGLNPYILKRFSGLDVERAEIEQASVVSMGSVLEHIPKGWGGHVIGAGRLYRTDLRPDLYTRVGKVWAVRGPLTARSFPGSFAIGDPGLLADELIADEVPARCYDLGVLPHWTDNRLTSRPEWFNDAWSTRVIMPSENPLQVVREIARCKKLVTSSLHGIIVADACGIPRRLEYTSSLDREGGKFKFEDYSASVHTPLEIGKTQEAPRFFVEDRKHELYDVLEAFGTYLRQT